MDGSCLNGDLISLILLNTSLVHGQFDSGKGMYMPSLNSEMTLPSCTLSVNEYSEHVLPT